MAKKTTSAPTKKELDNQTEIADQEAAKETPELENQEGESEKGNTLEEETSNTDTSEEATAKDILSINKAKYQFEVAGFYLEGKKFLAKDILENPTKYKLQLTKLLAMEGQNILKEV